jgi:hypothetical protein
MGAWWSRHLFGRAWIDSAAGPNSDCEYTPYGPFAVENRLSEVRTRILEKASQILATVYAGVYSPFSLVTFPAVG